jgi:hypothetical protein
MNLWKGRTKGGENPMRMAALWFRTAGRRFERVTCVLKRMEHEFIMMNVRPTV